MDTPETQEPKLADFGIKPGDYALYSRKYREAGIHWPCLVGLAAYALVVLSVGLLFGERGMWVTALWVWIPMMCVPGLAEKPIGEFRRSRLLETPIPVAIERYEKTLAVYQEKEAQRLAAERQTEEALREAERAQKEAERAQRRKLVEHWMSLDGLGFEREMATLYRYLGYSVQLTPTSGDQGIDLILRKDGRTTIVQCKSYKAPTGPATVREAYGSMVAFGADNAIVACTGGFTHGAEEFAQGKPITLLSTRELIELSETIDRKTTYANTYRPTCPEPGCSRPMVLRGGYLSNTQLLASCVAPWCAALMHSSRKVCPTCGTPQMAMCLGCRRIVRLNLVTQKGHCPSCASIEEEALTTEWIQGRSADGLGWSGKKFWVCSNYPNCYGTRDFDEG